MKNIILYILFSLFYLSAINAQTQCVDPDASIWKNTWASCEKSSNPKSAYGSSHWIQYNFGAVRNLSKTWIWNTNDPAQLNQGFHQVKIDYSEDGKDWTYWGEMNFPKGVGNAIYSGFSGPDLQNIKAQYVLVTALSNHGHPTCAGLAEIKFNLLPEDGEGIPIRDEDEEDEDEVDEDEDEDAEGDEDEDAEEDVCANINEIIVEEVGKTEAYLFWELEEEVEPIFLFEYGIAGEDYQAIEIEEPEIFLEELLPANTYTYRIGTICNEELTYTPPQSFTTLDCGFIETVEMEIEDGNAFIFWEATEDQEYYLIQFGLQGEEEKEMFELEESELFVEDIQEYAGFELQIGIDCGENIRWSDPIIIGQKVQIAATSRQSLLNNSSAKVFPVPTPGPLTIHFKSPSIDLLNYSIINQEGKVIYRNVREINKGVNNIPLDLTALPDGVYFLEALSLNDRKKISRKILKVSNR